MVAADGRHAFNNLCINWCELLVAQLFELDEGTVFVRFILPAALLARARYSGCNCSIFKQLNELLFGIMLLWFIMYVLWEWL